MRFILIDKVVSLQAGKQIKAVKNVSLSEEYLADHFPTFPVLPGVLLLEGLIESASWLVRKSETAGFRPLAFDVLSRGLFKSRRNPSKDRSTQTHVCVDFEGLLQVTDPAAFAEAWRAGIGPAKAFGFGLLSLAAMT